MQMCEGALQWGSCRSTLQSPQAGTALGRSGTKEVQAWAGLHYLDLAACEGYAGLWVMQSGPATAPLQCPFAYLHHTVGQPDPLR